MAETLAGCPHHRLTLGGLIRSLPYTLVGLLFGLGSLARPIVREGLILFHSRRIVAWLLLVRRGYAAVTFGRVVISAEPILPEDILVHERHHAYQYEQLGMIFLPIYLYWHMRAGYAKNPLEREAARCAEAWRVGQAGSDNEPLGSHAAADAPAWPGPCSRAPTETPDDPGRQGS